MFGPDCGVMNQMHVCETVFKIDQFRRGLRSIPHILPGFTTTDEENLNSRREYRPNFTT